MIGIPKRRREMSVSAVLRDKGVRFIGGGWVAFIAENLILSENREVCKTHHSCSPLHRIISFKYYIILH